MNTISRLPKSFTHSSHHSRLRALERVRKASIAKEVDTLVSSSIKANREDRLRQLQQTTDSIRSLTPSKENYLPRSSVSFDTPVRAKSSSAAVLSTDDEVNPLLTQF